MLGGKFGDCSVVLALAIWHIARWLVANELRENILLQFTD